jgi:beta-glucosidase
LKVPTKGTYEFHVGSDDGARLWVADQKVIDQWATHKFLWNHGSLQLESGYQPIRLEYFESKKGAGVELAWRFETDNKPSTIPRENLVPNEKYLEKE